MVLYGVEKSDFTAQDGSLVSGYWFYLGRPIDASRGSGVAVDRSYVLASRVPGGVPPIGSDLQLVYTRRGKVAGVTVLSVPQGRK